MRMPIDGGSVPAAQAGGDLVGGAPRVLVLLVVGPIAEAVLEVDPEILDRLARQLVDDARVDALGERRIETERRRQRRRVRRVLLQRRAARRRRASARRRP